VVIGAAGAESVSLLKVTGAVAVAVVVVAAVDGCDDHVWVTWAHL